MGLEENVTPMGSSSPSAARKLSQILISSAIKRCRFSGFICRLTISVKGFYNSHPPSIRISIADTGIGSNLVEFRDLDHRTVRIPAEKWDGVLSITTTSAHEKDIHRYCLNLTEPHSSRKRLKRLPPMHKDVRTFSGTEVCLTSAEEENIGEFVKWAVGFVRKIWILEIPDVVIELLVEHINNDGSRCESFLPEINKISSSLPASNIKRMVSGLEDYVLRNENGLNDNCHFCVKHSLMFGTGQANSLENNRGMMQIVEAVVMITPMPSCSCCRRSNCSATQVLYFQDFSPSSIPDSSLNALTTIDWQSYGLKPMTHAINNDEETVLEWENLQSFASISIAIHGYYGREMGMKQSISTASERKLTKKAIKLALDDVKIKHPTELLSSHAKQVCEYVPDLSRAIAGLILSSNDSGFQKECAALLGLQALDNTGEKVESMINDMITGIIEMNDINQKRNKNGAVHCLLFECENHLEEDDPNGDYREAPEDTSILDF